MTDLEVTVGRGGPSTIAWSWDGTVLSVVADPTDPNAPAAFVTFATLDRLIEFASETLRTVADRAALIARSWPTNPEGDPDDNDNR